MKLYGNLIFSSSLTCLSQTTTFSFFQLDYTRRHPCTLHMTTKSRVGLRPHFPSHPKPFPSLHPHRFALPALLYAQVNVNVKRLLGCKFQFKNKFRNSRLRAKRAGVSSSHHIANMQVWTIGSSHHKCTGAFSVIVQCSPQMNSYKISLYLDRP